VQLATISTAAIARSAVRNVAYQAESIEDEQ